MKNEIIPKLKRIKSAWNSLILPYQYCRDKVNYEEQELTDYIVGICDFFHDTFEIVFETKKYEDLTEMFSFHFSYLQSIYGYSGQNDQSSPDEIDHPHKTEPELVFSSLIAVTNL